MVFQQTPSTTGELAPVIVVIAVGNGDGWEKRGFGCRKNRFLWLSDAVNRDLLSLRTHVLLEHSFALSPVPAPVPALAATRSSENSVAELAGRDSAGNGRGIEVEQRNEIERAGEIGRGEQLFYELKRLTLNAPVYVVPTGDLPSLRCEPSLLCIVVHETVRSTLDTLTLPIPHMLIEHNDAGELRFVAFVTKRKEKRTRKRKKQKTEESR
jgi:hypothetical protein